MENKKNFSTLKWIIFPLLVAGFGCCIIYVSITVFTIWGSIPTIGLVAICLAISLVFVLHTSNHAVKPAKIAAFTFECLGVCALGITLVCSIVVLREYKGATQTIETEAKMSLDKDKEKTEQIKALASLKSKTAQATIAKEVVKPVETEQDKPKQKLTLAEVYAKAEGYLLYPLIVETGVYLLGLLIVFGLVEFLGNAKNDDSPHLPLDIPVNPYPATQARTTFLAHKAPLVAPSSTHKVINNNGFSLSLSPAGDGVSIRFHERGMQYAHVLRITKDRCESQRLETLDYDGLAKWVVAELESLKKTSKAVYQRIKNTL